MINSITDEWEDFVDEIKDKTGETIILEETRNIIEDNVFIIPTPEQPIVTDGVIRSQLYMKNNIEARVTTVLDTITIYSPTYVIYRDINDMFWHISVIKEYLSKDHKYYKSYKETIVDRLNFAKKESEKYNIAEDDRASSDIFGQMTLNPYNHIMH